MNVYQGHHAPEAMQPLWPLWTLKVSHHDESVWRFTYSRDSHCGSCPAGRKCCVSFDSNYSGEPCGQQHLNAAKQRQEEELQSKTQRRSATKISHKRWRSCSGNMEKLAAEAEMSHSRKEEIGTYYILQTRMGWEYRKWKSEVRIPDFNRIQYLNFVLTW